MGKTKLIAETGAGQHGVATATVAAKLGMGCKVFMGEVDIRRQYPNVYAMRLLGAEVIPVTHGTKTLKDAVNAALKNWIEHLEDTHYLIGSALGPAPYPAMVRDFQSVIGNEVRTQLMEAEGRLPDSLVACVGGGSNSLGLFAPFLNEPSVQCYGTEAGVRVRNRVRTRPVLVTILKSVLFRAIRVIFCRTVTARFRTPIPSARVWIMPGSARN